MATLYRRTLLVWLWLCAAGIAGEISVRNAATVDHAVVRLGDVADLYDVPAEERAALLDTELLPAPASGDATTLRTREIQEILARRSPDWATWTFSGASEVSVSRKASRNAKPAPVRAKSVSLVAADRAQDQLETAIEAYVHDRLKDNSWRVAATLSTEQIATLSAGKPFRVTGGRYLDAEHVQFRVEVGEATELETWKIDATVTRAEMIVVARHPLGRGEMITEHDVELAPLDDKAPATTHKPLTTLEEAIGKETTRPIAAGETILAPHVHETLMVRRGQVVTVYSRCGGVQIRTTGRAKENGSHGELIPIETIGSRESFHARVSGHQEVEIFAGAPTTPTVADAPRELTPYLTSRREGKSRPDAPVNPIRRTKPR